MSYSLKGINGGAGKFQSSNFSNDGNARKASTEDKTFIDKYVPVTLQPYAYLARIDNPIGTWLLYYPGVWSILMATYHNYGVSPDIMSDSLKNLALFGFGSLIMRSAGCTINDIWDKNIDRNVERTRMRPIAAGKITRLQGVAFLGLQLTAGLGILTQLNLYSVMLGSLSVFGVIGYPLAKRFISYPQLVLGGVFNWGALLGYVATSAPCYRESVFTFDALAMLTDYHSWSEVLTTIPHAVIPLYFGGIMATFVYDTIYAFQDLKDDRKVGINSSALTLLKSVKRDKNLERTSLDISDLDQFKLKRILKMCNVSSLLLFALAGCLNAQSFGFYSAIALSTYGVSKTINGTNLNSAVQCGKAFKRTGHIYGAGVSAGILLDIFTLMALN